MWNQWTGVKYLGLVITYLIKVKESPWALREGGIGRRIHGGLREGSRYTYGLSGRKAHPWSGKDVYAWAAREDEARIAGLLGMEACMGRSRGRCLHGLSWRKMHA